MKADIRRKESRESNRLCKKNEKSIRESRSGIEKSIGGDEKTSR